MPVVQLSWLAPARQLYTHGETETHTQETHRTYSTCKHKHRKNNTTTTQQLKQQSLKPPQSKDSIHTAQYRAFSVTNTASAKTDHIAKSPVAKWLICLRAHPRALIRVSVLSLLSLNTAASGNRPDESRVVKRMICPRNTSQRSDDKHSIFSIQRARLTAVVTYLRQSLQSIEVSALLKGHVREL